MILFVHNEITSKTANDFINQMQNEPLEVHIDSIGGDLFAGLKIYNALSSHPEDVQVVIDGLAGSVASVIALAGNKPVLISETGSIMIHNALIPNTSGNHNDLRKVANTLETYSNIVANIYAKKTNLSAEEALEMMNQESTFSAKQAIDFGFAQKQVEQLKAVAKINIIDMNLLETIKSKLKLEVEPTEPVAVEPTEPTEPTTEPTGEPFTPEQTEALNTMIAEAVAEALAGTPSAEEVGNTVATILNSIVSTGAPIQNAQPSIVEPEPTVQKTGLDAFFAKTKEIKANSNSKN